MVDVPPNKMAVMLLNLISNESKFKKNLVEKFLDEHNLGQVMGANGYAPVRQIGSWMRRNLRK